MVGEHGEQQLLACGPGSRLDADAFEPLGRIAVEPRGEQAVRDQAGREEALELRIGPGKLVERLLEHGVRLLSAEDEQLAAEQSRGLGAPHRARGQRMRLAQVLYCGHSAHVRLGRAELEEHLGALRVWRRLLEGASKVGDGALQGTARAGAPRGVAQRRDGLRICGRRAAQQVRGDAFRFRPGVGEQARGAGVSPVSLEGCERLVDRRADEWMDERQRRLRAQYVDPRERVNRLERRLLLQVGQRSCLAGIGVVAQDCNSLRERRRLRRKPGEAKGDGA